jgi:hypothetical protein
MKPKYGPRGNVDGERDPRAPDWPSGQFVDNNDIDQGVINLNQF